MSDLRYEIKFVLNESTLSDFMSWMFATSQVKKKYPIRTVNNLYFDDTEFSSVRDNLGGFPDRLKTRLRWYQSEIDATSPLVLEEKIRSGRLGNKKSIILNSFEGNIENMPLEDIMGSLRSQLPFDHNLAQHYFIPTLNVSYCRQYFEDLSGLRITIDEKIKFRSNFSLSRCLRSHFGVQYQSKIIEFKFRPDLRTHVNEMIRTLNISPVRHSKYLTGLAMFGGVNYL